MPTKEISFTLLKVYQFRTLYKAMKKLIAKNRANYKSVEIERKFQVI